MKTYKVALTEEELKAVISHHRFNDDWNSERAKRIHDLTKRLNADTVEIEKAEPAKEQSAAGWGED